MDEFSTHRIYIAGKYIKSIKTIASGREKVFTGPNDFGFSLIFPRFVMLSKQFWEYFTTATWDFKSGMFIGPGLADINDCDRLFRLDSL